MLFYLAYLVVVAWMVRLPWRQRRLVTTVAAADAAAIWWLSHQHGVLATLVSDWVPPLQILIAYWLSGAFFRRPMPRVEAWLARGDRWVFDRLALGRFVERAPRAWLESLELAYLSVYVVLPLGFAVARWVDPGTSAGRYWAIVMVAELVSYGALPWIQTRPPRALHDHLMIERRHLTVRPLNGAVLHHGSIQVNTFPSGHAAGAVATALAVAQVSPTAGVLFGIVAVGIVLGSVVGRYHYAADSLAGVVVAVLAWAVVR